jgi:hypothetical protein
MQGEARERMKVWMAEKTLASFARLDSRGRLSPHFPAGRKGLFSLYETLFSF